MADPSDTKPPTKWLWIGILALLAVATIIFVVNADGDEDLETIPDYAVTSEEERLYPGIEPTEDVSGMVDGTGAEDAESAIEPAPAEDTMAEQPAATE